MFGVWAVSAGIAAGATILAAAPLIALLAAVAGLAAGFVILEQKTGFFSTALPVVTDLLKDLYEIIGPTLYDALVTLKQGWDDLEPALSAVAAFLNSTLVPAFEAVGGFLVDHPKLLVALGAAILLLVAPWVLVIATIVLVLAKWDEIKAMFTQTIPQAIDSVITKIQELPIIGAIFTDTFNTVWTIVTTYFELIKVAFQLAVDTITNTFRFWKAIFTGEWGEAWQAVKDQFSTIVNSLDDVIGIAIDAVKTMVDSKLTMIGSIGSSIGSAIWEGIKGAIGTGSDLGQAFVEGIVGMINWIIRQINDAIPDKISIPLAPDITLPNIPEIGVPPSQGGGGRQWGGMMQYAEGGIVPGPVGAAQLAVVHGGERVLTPAQQRQQGTNVEIHIHSITGPDPQQMEQLRQLLAQVMRQEARFSA